MVLVDSGDVRLLGLLLDGGEVVCLTAGATLGHLSLATR